MQVGSAGFLLGEYYTRVWILGAVLFQAQIKKVLGKGGGWGKKKPIFLPPTPKIPS